MILLILTLYFVIVAIATALTIFRTENEINTVFEIALTVILEPFILLFAIIYKIGTLKIK